MSWLPRMAVCAVALTTFVSWAGSGVAVDRVTLWVEAPDQFAPLTVQQLERELQSIVEPAGLRIGWQRLPAQTGSVVDGVSIVVRFRGACSPASANAAAKRRTAAGWAHTSDGSILPFIEIDCDRIWSVIETDLEREPSVQREIHFGRALGRVIGHELRHVLANTATHGSEGLTKARLSSRDLITGTFSFREADLTPQIRMSDSSSPIDPVESGPALHALHPGNWGAASPAAVRPASQRSLLPEEPSATGR